MGASTQTARQSPPSQRRASSQVRSQAPQCAGSRSRSTHLSPHRAEVPQSTHSPASQRWVGAQAWPQAPQCSGATSSETHPSPQSVSPAAQASHRPSWQRSPALQLAPQAPQCSTDCRTSTHRSSQRLKPSGQSGPSAVGIQAGPTTAPMTVARATQLQRRRTIAEHCRPARTGRELRGDPLRRSSLPVLLTQKLEKR